MGCLGSKTDNRRKALDGDYNGVEYVFNVGAVKTADGFSPLDKLVIKFCGGEGKEIKDGIGELDGAKMAEEKAKELGEKIFKALKDYHKKLTEKFKDGTKDGEVMGKYTGTDAIAQVDAALTLWSEKSGIEGHKWPEVAAADADMLKDLGMDGDKDGGEAAEGGKEEEGGDAKKEEGGETKAAAKENLIKVDAFGEIAGPAELPKLLLAICLSYPVVGDAVKAQVCHWELGGDSSDHESFGAVAAITGAYVNAGEKEEKDSFGAAWVDDNTLEELKEVAADKSATKALIFPGVVCAWADEATALGQATEVKGRTQVLYKFKGKVMKPAGDQAHVFCRQFAKVESLEAGGEGKNYQVCTLSDYADHVKATAAEFAEHCKTLAAAVSEVKEGVEAAKEGAAEENKEGADGDAKGGEGDAA